MAIKCAYEAIDRNEDIFTGGPVEIVTISKKGVQNYGPALRRSAKKAIRSELEKIIKENPGEIILVPIGPLTNIAELLLKNPKIIYEYHFKF